MGWGGGVEGRGWGGVGMGEGGGSRNARAKEGALFGLVRCRSVRIESTIGAMPWPVRFDDTGFDDMRLFSIQWHGMVNLIQRLVRIMRRKDDRPSFSRAR